MNNSPPRLLVVSHVVHYTWQGQLFAYGPYSREIDIWADLFDALVIASPCRSEAPPGDCLPFTNSNISISPIRETGGTTVAAKLAQILRLPFILFNLCRAMHKADAIHVRCPGNLGLLGALLAPTFSRCIVAKYAGQWMDYPGEALTYTLQRNILRSFWWKGPVTVYGEWPDQPRQIVPFFTSILTEAQIQRAVQASQQPWPATEKTILYVGRLSQAKNVDRLISALASLKQAGLTFRCKIVGAGPEHSRLIAQAAALGVAEQIEFTGGIQFEEVLHLYETSNILVLASETEGWPKVIAEGMAFGLVCIGSNQGLIPQMLGEGRGLTVPPGDVAALTSALRYALTDPGACEAIRHNAAPWAQAYSLEGLRDALRVLLQSWWQLPPDALSASTQREAAGNSV